MQTLINPRWLWYFILLVMFNYILLDCPLLSARWIGNHGFSIGIDDVQPGEHLTSQKKKKIDDGYRECYDLISSYSKGNLTLQPGCNAAQTLELKITNVLNEIRATAGNVRALLFLYLLVLFWTFSFLYLLNYYALVFLPSNRLSSID